MSSGRCQGSIGWCSASRCASWRMAPKLSYLVSTMTAPTQTLLLLSAVLVVVAIVARRLTTAPSILLVIAGIGLALAPGLPRIELAPELVLLGILPPLIYSAGVARH